MGLTQRTARQILLGHQLARAARSVEAPGTTNGRMFSARRTAIGCFPRSGKTI